MDKIEAVFFNSETNNAKLQFIFAICFPFFTVLALGIDSVFFTEHYFNGRQITNLLGVLYFAGFFYASKSHLRKLMLVMVWLSYIGELIFCKLLGMYEYRTPAIPLYVPFGHAIVYASGYVYAYTEWSINKELHLRKYFLVFFVLLFLGVGIFLKDYFSLFFGILFFGLLKRKSWQNLYCFVAFCVIFIELAGTYFKCWAWVPNVFGYIPTSNPPMGAVFFYAGGDVLLAKIVGVWENKKKIE
ncbi:hypothetical protein GKZ90_0000455 [Flavobacterium sp. MC2016-06]|jgi:hypothetical protein|uniref:hypothetical protein n=1 Tax=Flavobacterium sp. MC2016-06 TaxID=2676308 RepID=UPI0012BACA43|nr:hypothetical protein [Flavobacterium sp. MC2016-06]MBU3859542.1 hypothetical protein [Flavobacterium sp. MC2016-06]